MNSESEYVARLGKTIDQHVATNPEGRPEAVGRIESHDLNSLSTRICASPEVTLKLLGSGVLRAENPTIRGDDTRFAFRSDHLQEIKQAILTTVVERVIDEATSLDEVTIAAPYALREYVAGFKKDATKAKPTEFSAFPAGLVQLSRDPRGRFYVEEEPSDGTIKQAVGTAGTAAGVYGAAAYIRGRAPGRNPFEAVRAGHAANKVTGRKIGSWFKPKADRVAAAGAGLMDKAASVLRSTVRR